MGCSFAVILLKSRDVFYLLKILEILDYYSLIPPFPPPLAGQRLFRREGAGGSDSHSETSSVGQAEDLSRERVPQPTPPYLVPDEAVSMAPEISETPQVPAKPEPTQENGEVGTQEGEQEERQPEGQEAPVEETGR